MDLVLSTAYPVLLPLASDPTVAEVNSDAALATYKITSDAEKLTVPEQATLFTVHALTTDEVAKAEARAGRRERRGARLYAEMIDAALTAGIEAARADGASEDAYLRASHAKLDDFWDGVSDEDELKINRHELWSQRRSLEICRLAIDDVTGLPLTADAAGFPMERLVRALDAGLAEAKSHLTATALITELAGHILKVGRLGKGGLTSCHSRSGMEDTPTPQPGPATNAQAG